MYIYVSIHHISLLCTSRSSKPHSILEPVADEPSTKTMYTKHIITINIWIHLYMYIYIYIYMYIYIYLYIYMCVYFIDSWNNDRTITQNSHGEDVKPRVFLHWNPPQADAVRSRRWWAVPLVHELRRAGGAQPATHWKKYLVIISSNDTVMIYRWYWYIYSSLVMTGTWILWISSWECHHQWLWSMDSHSQWNWSKPPISTLWWFNYHIAIEHGHRHVFTE